ncbi:MAG: hypothetical protein GC164_04830 [Phycisphaera sp.]|nr:hypothetical protein [Phycisphaera sp.]
MRHTMKTYTLMVMTVLALCVPVWAVDEAHRTQAEEAIKKGLDYLRTKQNEDGSWTPKPGPAVTALVLNALLDQPNASLDDPATRKAYDYVLSAVKPDGSIQNGILENYNTSIALSAFSRLADQPGMKERIKAAQDYLRSLQWHNQADPDGATINEQHPFYGGAGYGGEGRPDMSNTQMMIQALYDSGLDCNDPAFQRAMVFITRCQGVKENKEFGDKIVNDGGFIYSTSIGKDHIGVPESKASPDMIKAGEAGQPVSGLRTYGSVSYAGFKSYIYAQLPPDDPRVAAVLDWVKHNYTLDQNPGLTEPQKLQGLYYYYLTFARAMRAWEGVSKSPTLTTADGKGHDWAQELIEKLTSLQKEDGSWTNEADRWMEADPSLVTAYAVLALQQTVR